MIKRWHAMAIVVIAACVGCGGNGVPMGSVSATVTLDGAPIEKAVIRFTSEGVRGARGMVVDGQIIDVSTFVPGDGVPVGSHRVTVQETYAMTGGGSGASAMRPVTNIPKQYSNVMQTPLVAEIARGDNEFTFELESGR